MTRVPGFKMCQGCQGFKGARGAWVKSSEGLLGGRVFSRTHFRSSLTPEEVPSCYKLKSAISKLFKSRRVGRDNYFNQKLKLNQLCQASLLDWNE